MNRLDTLAPAMESSESSTPHLLQDSGRVGASEDDQFRHINVGQRERAVSLVTGGALVVLGLVRGKLSGLVLAGLGGWIFKRGLDGHCALYGAMGINTAMEDHADPATLYERGVKIYETVTVSRPARELYDFWHNFQNHPRFMPNVEAVSVEGDRSHWRLSAPGGVTVEYEAQIINDEPGRLIAWRSAGGADIQHAGTVRFVESPHGRGTEVHFNVEYVPPAGHVGRFGEKLLRYLGRSPHQDVRQGLRNFKRLVEEGEVTDKP